MHIVYCYGPNDDFDRGEYSKRLGPFKSLDEAHLAGDLQVHENIIDPLKKDDFVFDVESIEK